MYSRLTSLNPIGLVLLLVGVGMMLCDGLIPERLKLHAKLVALLLAAIGTAIAFL